MLGTRREEEGGGREGKRVLTVGWAGWRAAPRVAHRSGGGRSVVWQTRAWRCTVCYRRGSGEREGGRRRDLPWIIFIHFYSFQQSCARANKLINACKQIFLSFTSIHSPFQRLWQLVWLKFCMNPRCFEDEGVVILTPPFCAAGRRQRLVIAPIRKRKKIPSTFTRYKHEQLVQNVRNLASCRWVTVSWRESSLHGMKQPD